MTQLITADHHQIFSYGEHLEHLFIYADSIESQITTLGPSSGSFPDNNSPLVETWVTPSNYTGNSDPWNGVSELRQPKFPMGYVAYFSQPHEFPGQPFHLLHYQHDDLSLHITPAQELVASSSCIWSTMTGPNIQSNPDLQLNGSGYDGQHVQAQHGTSLNGCHRGGGRQGPLDPESRKEARDIRKIGACLQCWARKVKVSLAPPVLCHIVLCGSGPDLYLKKLVLRD